MPRSLDSLIAIVHIAKSPQVCDDVRKHLVARHHDVNVEDRLCPEVRHCRAAHVFDTQDKLAK